MSKLPPSIRTASAKARGVKRSVEAPRYGEGRRILCEASLAEARAALLASDPYGLGQIVSENAATSLRSREPGFTGLVAIVVAQQVSVASARAIFARLEARLRPLTPEAVLAAGETVLRECGLSGPKLRAVTAVAQAVSDGLDLAALADRPAADAHRELVAVKGIGPWTADIFLMLSVGHPDAFPSGDLALQEAARLALKLEARPDARELERLADPWRPRRGVAARILWDYYLAMKSRAGVIDFSAPLQLAKAGGPE